MNHTWKSSRNSSPPRRPSGRSRLPMTRTAAHTVFRSQQLNKAPVCAVQERTMSENDHYATYEPVPEGYDLLAAKACELDCFGIPPRPTEPQLLKFWKKLVSPPFHAERAEPDTAAAAPPWHSQPPNNLESSL